MGVWCYLREKSQQRSKCILDGRYSKYDWGGFLLSSGLVVENASEIVWNGPFIFGLSFGVTIGMSVAYIIYYTLINQGEASKVGSATFLVPIIAVCIGVLFLDETLTIKLLIGMTLVGISIYLVNFNEKEN